MLNKKGTSIIELIVSIALLSVILTFMLKLLVDLNNVRTNTSFAKENQIIRSEIIRTIENDIKNTIITGITSNNINGNLKLKLNFKDGKTSTINIAPTKLVYTKRDTKKRTWNMDSCTLYPNKVFVNRLVSSSSDTYGFILNIQVHTSNKENKANHNNPLDDIQISYFGKDNNDYSFNEYYSIE